MKYAIFSKKNTKEAIDVIEYLKNTIIHEYDEENPDIVITVGGDGTILRAVQKYVDVSSDIIYFGINTGHLGFYTNWTSNDLVRMCNLINEKKYMCENHSILEWNTMGKKGYALNEINLMNPTSTQIVSVYVDNNVFETVRCTGLCVSTTNGSTAYSKAIGGPVIDHMLDCLILSEIAPINSNAYRSLNSPLVLSTERELELKYENGETLSYDHLRLEIDRSGSIKIKLSDKKIKFGCMKKDMFIERLQKAFL